MDAPQTKRHGGRHRGRHIPPVVRHLATDATQHAAYLLAWERRADGWWGRIAWVEAASEATDEQLRGKSSWASARQLQPVPGQIYDQVPRTRRADPRPHDPTDPRDPGKMSRWEARALHERRNLPRREDPDF